MRIRALVVAALFTLPSALSAQLIRLPRIGRGTPTTEPASLPPEAPAVARALAYKRSRWSAEGYSLISSVQAPDVGGGFTRSNTFGTGTRADYRYTDHLSATFDLTTSFPGEPTTAQTVEVGTRLSPMSWDHALRPFFDLRAAYMNMYDSFTMPTQDPGGLVGSAEQFVEGGRYSHGFGSVAGAGVEYSLTHSLALTTGLSAMRNRMTTYRLTTPTSLPVGGINYWMTSVRYTLGFRFNPTRTLHLAQNPAQ